MWHETSIGENMSSSSTSNGTNGVDAVNGAAGKKRKFDESTGKKKLVLNAFVMMCMFLLLTPQPTPCNLCSLDISRSRKPTELIRLLIRDWEKTGSGHQSPGLWKHPDDQSHRFADLDYWIDLAKLLEKGKFHGMFIADVLGQWLSNEYIS